MHTRSSIGTHNFNSSSNNIFIIITHRLHFFFSPSNAITIRWGLCLPTELYCYYFNSNALCRWCSIAPRTLTSGSRLNDSASNIDRVTDCLNVSPAKNNTKVMTTTVFMADPRITTTTSLMWTHGTYYAATELLLSLFIIYTHLWSCEALVMFSSRSTTQDQMLGERGALRLSRRANTICFYSPSSQQHTIISRWRPRMVIN